MEAAAKLRAGAAGAPESFAWSRLAPACCLRGWVHDRALLPLVRALWPATVEGLQHLEGLPLPAIFAASHCSHLDTPVVLAALPARIRQRLAVAAAQDYFFANRVSAAVAAGLFNAVPVSRHGSARGSLDRCVALLRDEWSLLIYPQGSRCPEMTFRPGVGFLARTTGLPVVPVAIDGTQQGWAKGSPLPQPYGVRVAFGRPAVFEAGLSAMEIALAVEARVRAML